MEDYFFGNENARPKSTGAIVIFGLENNEGNNISSNRYEYWLHGLIFDIGFVKIQKDHKLGQFITSVLEDDKDFEKIRNKVNQALLKRMKIEDFYCYLRNEKADSFNEGVKYIQNKIKSDLGIRG